MHKFQSHETIKANSRKPSNPLYFSVHFSNNFLHKYSKLYHKLRTKETQGLKHAVNAMFLQDCVTIVINPSLWNFSRKCVYIWPKICSTIMKHELEFNISNLPILYEFKKVKKEISINYQFFVLLLTIFFMFIYSKIFWVTMCTEF